MPGRVRRAAAGAVFVASAGACSLLVDTSDLASGAGAAADGGHDAVGVDPINGRDAGGGGDDAATGTTTTPDARTSGPYRDAVIADGPVGYWRLGDAAGATIVGEETASRTAGASHVVFGAVGPTVGNTAGVFDGSTSVITVPDLFDFSGTHAFSIEAWVSPRVFDGCRHIFTREQRSSTKVGYALLFTAEGGVFLERFVGGVQMTSRSGSPIPLPVDVFSHVVGTYDGAGLRLYVDGVLRNSGSATDTRPLPASTRTTVIGAASTTTLDCSYDGKLADVAVYDKELSAARIAAHFAAR